MVKDFRDIQSLRAIAVLLVVGYHLNSQLFKFGYLGVDIFFVISGFIITHLILKNQSFHIINFYQKRIARIFPAMALVTLTTVAVGSIFLRTDDLLNLTYQGILSLLGVSNIYFATTQIGYFEIESFRQPLLHLWSLSTEIQFYLVAPIFILLFKKINTYVKQIFISVLFILSIALYIDFISLPGIDNYYLLTSRIWEFVIGSYIATLNNRKKIDYFTGKLATIIALLSLMSLNLVFQKDTIMLELQKLLWLELLQDFHILDLNLLCILLSPF
jgi:peptidoglycan/LPS O-acetylase OafA/YrhL